jgi:hypothetical protein
MIASLSSALAQQASPPLSAKTYLAPKACAKRRASLDKRILANLP